MTRRDLKKLPWLGISGVSLQALAFGLGFIAMGMGLQIGLMIGLLSIGTVLLVVEHLKDKKKFKERDSHHFVGIILTLSAMVLVATLVTSLVFGMPMICLPVALGMSLLSTLAVGYKIEKLRHEAREREHFGDEESDDENEGEYKAGLVATPTVSSTPVQQPGAAFAHSDGHRQSRAEEGERQPLRSGSELKYGT